MARKISMQVAINEAIDQEMRRDHLPGSFVGQEPHYYVVTLEYGPHRGDPFAIERDPAPEAAREAFYLHPIVRRYDRGQLVAEHHINDDLEHEWFLPEYVEPAMAFFQAQLTGDWARA